MIDRNKIDNLRKELESAQNPLFFYDNDVDGFCSFLILRRSLDRGRGVAIKSFPDLKAQYLRKVDELKPDKVIVLDKAEISEEFINGCIERGVLIVWIDHHETKTPKDLIDKTAYFNSVPSSEPTTYIAQSVFSRKEDLWLAMIGCIGDVFMPEYAKQFEEIYPELFDSNLNAFEALHKTEVGKMVRMLNFGLMNSISNVVKLTKYLFKAGGPHDLFEENYNTKEFHKRCGELGEFYNKQVQKAMEESGDLNKLVFFSYGGGTSMSSMIANRLYFLNPDKLVVVAYKRFEKANISIRGRRAFDVTRKVVEKIPFATGGGHKEATGAMVPIDEFERFKKLVTQEVKNE